MNFTLYPTISVILPTYNRETRLVRAVQSVIAQTFTNWELIVVDDGSTDKTFERISEFMKQYQTIRYMKHSNRKPAISRNAGIQASFGRYITFLDSDDHYLPEHLESRFIYLEKHPDTDLISGGFCGDDDVYVTDCYHPERTIHIQKCILGATLFGKRNLFFSLGGFENLDYAEDTDFWKRASERFSVKKLVEPKTYVYERSDDSITRNR
ncbi:MULTISPECIES: glycosyltransferase family 2 protein [Prosthecochloris]|uniref:Glycosyl transferase n=1 Tax=Prosthecochloris marina TaxID=2017681 RepID=A0A317TBH1_9CHLB|nr:MULTISPECIES: glycosyltransferase family A protein [Prosthecochloris]PWW83377.1 glycosyl transferase [Prosthecochloris marina]UZJ36583.1 glycosyltransferase family 2 protein [Prosthecochloris sp. SCSIO W1103]